MTVVSLAQPISVAEPPPGAAARTRSSIEILHGIRSAEPAWRALEAGAVMAPYGRFDWAEAFLRGTGVPERDVRVAVLRGPGGEPDFLLPVQLRGSRGLAIAEAIGGKHSNLNLPLARPGFLSGLSPEGARALLLSAGRALRADLLLLPHVPVLWDGRPNPFAADGQPSPSNGWALALEPDGDATLARSMSADARKKLRNKTRQLERDHAVRVLRATAEAEVDLILAAFYRQKEQRFGELGIADPFAAPGIRDFLQGAALNGLAEGRPAIELYGLQVDDEIVAVLGGAVDRRRFSGMVVSFQAGPLSRLSPGEILVTRVVRLLCERGLAVFDLGVGDARYKRSICDTEEALVDVSLPLSARGRLSGIARSGLVALKRRVKASPRAMEVVARLRRAKAALRA